MDMSLINDLTDNLLESWRRLVTENNSLDKFEAPMLKFHWLDKYCITLCNVTANFLWTISNQQLIEILQIITSFLRDNTTDIKLSVLCLLKSITYLEVNVKDVIQHIATLFRLLLQDSDSMVRVQSLEGFTYLAANTSCEAIIAETVQNNDIIKAKVSNFLRRNVDNCIEAEYECKCRIFTHKCTSNQSDSQKDSMDYLGFSLSDLSEEMVSEVDSQTKRIKYDESASQRCEEVLDLMLDKVKVLSEQREIIKSSNHLNRKLTDVCNILNSIC